MTFWSNVSSKSLSKSGTIPLDVWCKLFDVLMLMSMCNYIYSKLFSFIGTTNYDFKLADLADKIWSICIYLDFILG